MLFGECGGRALSRFAVSEDARGCLSVGESARKECGDEPVFECELVPSVSMFV